MKRQESTRYRGVLALVLLAGCGEVTPADRDAGTGDAAPDADEGGDATIVTEAALFGGTIGAKVANIDIISMLPNNTVLATARTDASGNATIRVYPGGTVTAVYRHAIDMGADLITWAGVKPGDKLTFGSRLFSTSGQMNLNLGAMTYSWPAQAGATIYRAATSCSTGSVSAPATTVNVTEFSLCHKEPMDVLFIAQSGSTLTHYSFRSNQTFTSGGTISTSSWSTAQMGSVNITGLPPEVTSLSGNFRTVLDANREVGFAPSYSGTPTGGAFTATFPWHPTGERTVGRVLFGRPGFSTMQLYDSFTPSTLTETVAAPAFTPWLQGGTIASSALREASWAPVPEASSVHDGQLLRVNWSHTISGTSHPHQWHFIVPPDQTSIAFPRLPAQFTDNVPAPQDSMGASIRIFDVSSVSGYDMLRTLPSSTIMCLECAVRAGDVQRVVFTE
jgi:hypothetical protein